MTGRRLEVLLYDRLVGHVTQDWHGRHTFTYADGYLALPDATALSLSLPVVAAEHPASRIRPYMAGLLPDSEEGRSRWAAKFGVSAANYFALLEHVGLDCAGAVQFIPEGVTANEDSILVPLADGDIAGRLAALRKDDSAWAVPGDRWSLGGAQGKFALARDAHGRWCEPLGRSASTHIFKPGVEGYRAQALNEHVCLATATVLGLPAVHTEYTQFAGEGALVVTRYDRRRRTDGTVARVHQEDMCQALAVYPAKKYEASGGPGAARITDLLRRVTAPGRDDVGTFVRAVIFNYLIGAPDAHAKNYSVLVAGRDVQLAPLYDIASGLPYDPQVTGGEIHQSAMSIGGRREFGGVEGRHWDRFAAACHVPADFVREQVKAQATDLPGALEASFAGHENDPLRERMLVAVSDLTARTVSGLGSRTQP